MSAFLLFTFAKFCHSYFVLWIGHFSIVVVFGSFTVLTSTASAAIYVGNLSYDVEKKDLKEVFSKYGDVKNVQLPTDRETGRKRGFAFVEMAVESDEQKAVDALDGAEWMGRNLQHFSGI